MTLISGSATLCMNTFREARSGAQDGKEEKRREQGWKGACSSRRDRRSERPQRSEGTGKLIRCSARYRDAVNVLAGAEPQSHHHKLGAKDADATTTAITRPIETRTG